MQVDRIHIIDSKIQGLLFWGITIFADNSYMITVFRFFCLGIFAALLAFPAPAQDEPVSPPRAFRELTLGMGLEELKDALKSDELFRFRGDRDVSLLPSPEQSLIETTGVSYIRRAFFQLKDGELFIMAFSLNSGMVDHYSVYTSFVKKYGEPQTINPREAVWEDENTRVAIERPLTVKYIDKRVFDDLVKESQTARSAELSRREEFLGEF